MTLPESAASRRPQGRRLARFGATLLAPVSIAAAFVLGAPSATANAPGPHDPIGKVEMATAGADGTLHLVGWAIDPDTTGNIRVAGQVDGVFARSTLTSIARPGVAAAQHSGPTPGFDLTVPVPRTGIHTVCLTARNLGAGIGRVLRCVTVPLGTRLSSQQQSMHNPRAFVSSTTATSSAMRVTGWANEPDFRNGRMLAVLYVDGHAATTVVTQRSTAAQRGAGAGRYGAFDITVPVSSGSHLGCVWIVDSGIGQNATPGCRTADTRGGPGTRTVYTPAANLTAVQEAKRHVGQPYVWGATGPRQFDCSGLVLYSYAKAAVTTPRVSSAQFAAARVIPASRAVAGDLVFYHDNVGAVYHVGIYLAPLETVAAVDENTGVAFQHIWDPSSATYGSFTHR